MLIYLSMISLAYAGGSFTHGHELPDNNKSHQIEHSHAGQHPIDQTHSHNHDADTSIDKETLHCGAMILTLSTVPVVSSEPTDASIVPRLVCDLVALVFSLEPPPPRFA